MRKMIAVSSVLAALAMASSAASQTRALADTFDLIRATLEAQGVVAWQNNLHDSAPEPGKASDWTVQRRAIASNIHYDLPDCSFRYHWLLTADGAVAAEVPDAAIPFRELRIIKVTRLAAIQQQMDSQSGHPTYSVVTQPDVITVEAIRSDGQSNALDFYDRQTARQVADDFERAAEICGVTNIVRQ